MAFSQLTDLGSPEKPYPLLLLNAKRRVLELHGLMEYFRQERLGEGEEMNAEELREMRQNQYVLIINDLGVGYSLLSAHEKAELIDFIHSTLNMDDVTHGQAIVKNSDQSSGLIIRMSGLLAGILQRRGLNPLNISS